MYTIGYIVYGFNFNTLDQETRRKFSADFCILIDDDTITSRYSGSGDRAVYFGIELDQIDEATDVFVMNLKLAPSEVQEKEYADKATKLLARDDISQEFKNLIAGVLPQPFITWGSS